METRFHIIARPNEGEKAVVKLSGPITERASFVGQWGSADVLKVDLTETTSMNSTGLRLFKNWIHSLRYSRIELIGCPVFLINQLNMIPDLIPSTVKVVSFFVPFYSPAQDEEAMVLFREGIEVQEKNGGLNLHIPEVLDSKGRPMEMDVVSERYFYFIRRQRGLI